MLNENEEVDNLYVANKTLFINDNLMVLKGVDGSLEKWKDIDEFKGLYQVSNLGNVRSLDTIINCKGANNIDSHIRKGKLLRKNKYSGKYGKEAQFSKPLLQFTIDGKFIKEWENASQVKRELGYCAENIRSVCNGKRKTANGYK